MKTLKLYGGPGCGKTHTLLRHFEDELKEFEPEQIAFLTFTRAARQEAVERSKKAQEDLPYVRTIHSICYKQLGISNVGIVTPKDVCRFGEKVGVEMEGTTIGQTDGEAEFPLKPPKIGDLILQLGWHLAQHRQVPAEQILRTLPGAQPKLAKYLLAAYANWKTSEGIIDYTDLLLKYLEMGDMLEGVEVLFVDEAQDLSKLQWSVIAKLESGVQRRYLAGDDDQAIFAWAGADPDAFNAEPADETLVLPKSVRLPQLVHAASQGIIQRVRGRYNKEFAHRDEVGQIIRGTKLREEYLTGDKVFLLYRNHYRGQALVKTLQLLGIPYMGLSPLDDREVRLSIEALELARKSADLTKEHLVALARFGNPAWVQLSTGLLNAKSVPSSLVFHKPTDGVDLQHVLSKLPNIKYLARAYAKHGVQALLAPKVHVMSIHRSKGQEADTVLLDFEMSRRTYETMYGQLGKSPDEEHRVFYVGMTRARYRLITLLPEGPFYYPFLK